MRANSFNTGIASEYLILSKLFRLDLEAYISQGNKKSVDIRVIRENGTPISIDVKSVRDYSSLVVNNVVPKRDHFIAFVIYNNKFEDLTVEPEIFIVPSIELHAITDIWGDEKRVMKGKLENYKDKWEYIKSAYGEVGEIDKSPERLIIENHAVMLDLRSINYTEEQICSFMHITENELKTLENDYARLVQKQ